MITQEGEALNLQERPDSHERLLVEYRHLGCISLEDTRLAYVENIAISLQIEEMARAERNSGKRNATRYGDRVG